MSPWLSDLYLRSQSDQRLLSLARDGNGGAFALLAERYRSELVGSARRLAAAAEAEDIVQQTLLSAFAAIQRGTEVQHVRAWLHAILRNTAMRARLPVTRPLPADGLPGEPACAVLDVRDEAREVLDALGGLPVRQREALIGSTVQGLSRSELAAVLGVSEGAVRQLVHRARAALRSAVSALVPYPLARWLAGAASGPGGAGVMLAATGSSAGGAGLAAAGGLLPKLGLIAAAAAIAVAGGSGHPARSRPGSGPGLRSALALSAGPAVRRPAGSAASILRVSTPDASPVTGHLGGAGQGGSAGSSGGAGSPGGPDRSGSGGSGSPGAVPGSGRPESSSSADPRGTGGPDGAHSPGGSDGRSGTGGSGGSHGSGGSSGSAGSVGSGGSEGSGGSGGSDGSGGSGGSDGSGGSGGSGGSSDARAAGAGTADSAGPGSVATADSAGPGSVATAPLGGGTPAGSDPAGAPSGSSDLASPSSGGQGGPAAGGNS
ncbi:MAG TPA: RNA polymerase sigma factor [Solirubrobacteraceae bacterium]|nr:RNA polymerase sigma factor [Solirubrobacteraceae bacterium]